MEIKILNLKTFEQFTHRGNTATGRMIAHFFEVHGVDYSIEAFFTPQPPGGLLEKKIKKILIQHCR